MGKTIADALIEEGKEIGKEIGFAPGSSPGWPCNTVTKTTVQILGSMIMETIKTRAIIGEDRHLQIDLEVSLPPGPVEVVVVVSPEAEPISSGIDPESVRQQFFVAAGCGESGDSLSSRRIDEILYGRKS